jgi:asparagine synthase (glutamine-hydrolysing)
MTTLCAIFNRDGQPADASIVAAMQASSQHHGQNGQDIWIGDSVALAHQHFWVTPEEVAERQPLVDPLGRFAITCDARVDNRDELIGELGIRPSEGRTMSDAALILRAYMRWGAECTARILGDYAFAAWDRERQELFLARDPLGGRGLSYYDDGHVFVAATDTEQLLAHPAVNPVINDRKVARYLVQSYDDEGETYFESLYYLPPAWCMSVTPEGVRKWRFWEIDPGLRIRYKRDEEYGEHFRTLFTEAVRCRLRAVGPVGLSLSGGMDSTSIAAVATSLLSRAASSQSQLKTFSYVFDQLPSCDERQFILPTVERFDLDATYILCDDRWPLRDLAEWPLERDWVVSDAYVWLPLSVMRAADAAGCRVLFTGHFGDALFWDDTYWASAMLHDGRLAQLGKTLAGSRSLSVWREALADPGMRARIPGGLRRAYRRVRPHPRAASQAMVDPNLLRRTEVDPGRKPEMAPHAFSAPGQRQHYETLIAGGAFEGRPMARRLYRRSGLELMEPFCDRRLVSFVMAIPADQWGRAGRGKWVLRSAMRERLPRGILERAQPTSFEALWDRGLREREPRTVEELLTNSQIVNRGYVRAGWLQDELYSGRPWAEDGFLLWLCISLELWLRRFW